VVAHPSGRQLAAAGAAGARNPLSGRPVSVQLLRQARGRLRASHANDARTYRI